MLLVYNRSQPTHHIRIRWQPPLTTKYYYFLLYHVPQTPYPPVNPSAVHARIHHPMHGATKGREREKISTDPPKQICKPTFMMCNLSSSS